MKKRQIIFFERRAQVTADSEGINEQRLTAPKQTEKELPEASCLRIEPSLNMDLSGK